MFLSGIGVAALFAQNRGIDSARSTITIHVGKAGLLSAAGHEHWVEAPIASGTLNESEPQVEFTVAAARMQVKPDAKVSAKDEAEVQKNMQETVLESGRFPEIVFRSSRIEKGGAGEWKVAGQLALHGVTRPVSVTVRQDNGAYAGHTTIKQTDFGIKPIRAGAGLVRVKDELEIDFRVLARNP